jgi:putative endonuclease
VGKAVSRYLRSPNTHPGGGIGRPACRQAGALVLITSTRMECSVYALASLEKEYIYVGLSLDVVRRISEHQRGKEPTTRAYRPFEVVLIEVLPNRMEARKREKFLKSGAGKEFLKEIRDR